MEGQVRVGEKLSLRLMRRPLIGLDIDDSSVRMIRLRRRNEGYAVVAAAVAPIAPSGDDPDLYRTNTVEAIATCFETLGPGKKLAVCGLRGPEIVVRGFDFPALPPEEIQGAVELETSQMCPFGPNQGVFDHQVIPTAVENRDDKTRGFWVAANGVPVEDKCRLVREAGLQCVLMDADGLALLNCYENSDGRRQAEAFFAGADCLDSARPVLLDVGDSHASIAIVDHLGRPFVRDVRPGSREIVRQMARQMRAAPEQVSAALRGDAELDDTLLGLALERACAGLVDEVVSTLRYYGAQNRSVRVEKVLVCGSFARAKGFIELLAAKLPIEVSLWDPVGRMACESDSPCEAVVRQAGPALAVAAGLAMRTI